MPQAEPEKRGNKYGATRTEVDGVTFASKAEAKRYSELKLMQMAGQITDLELQPEFPLHVMRVAYSECPIRMTTVAVYRADFSYLDLRTGEWKIEDVKGMRNPLYILKRKLTEAIHGITVTEIP